MDNGSLIGRSQPMPRPHVALPTDGLGPPGGPPKKLAAITTAYYKYSHADDIITKFIEGYGLIGRVHQPHCDVVGLYVEQFVASDIGRGMAARYEIPMFESVTQCLTQGGSELAVDGVLLIGEHGEFPVNDQGQKLYPRRRLFEEIVEVFRSSGRSVPVFNDKHLAYRWEDARWIADQATELGFPLMAGSSVPVAWRLPPLAFSDGIQLDDALSVYYIPPHLADGVDYAAYHALETLQAFVEHRGGGETGVRSVHVVEGAAAWEAAKRGAWSPELLAAALATVPAAQHLDLDAAALRQVDPDPVVIVVEYTDGFRSAVYLNRDLVTDEFCFAARVTEVVDPVATWCYMVKPARDHFSFLCNHIECMFRTGRASYPMDRTLLVTGVLAAAAESRYAGNRPTATPHLQTLAYTPRAEFTGDRAE